MPFWTILSLDTCMKTQKSILQVCLYCLFVNSIKDHGLIVYEIISSQNTAVMPMHRQLRNHTAISADVAHLWPLRICAI